MTVAYLMASIACFPIMAKIIKESRGKKIFWSLVIVNEVRGIFTLYGVGHLAGIIS